MKKSFFKLFAIVALLAVAFSVNALAGDRAFADYKITPVENQELKTGAECAWLLTYNENESQIMIELQRTKRCKNYIVRGDHFEVVYVCSGNGFGARAAKMSECKLPVELTSQVINANELAKQRLISSNPMDDEKALGLIAAYLPDLVNPSYQHLLN
ncbi:hypothetical protein [Gaoshiqia sediminis]|uniref:Uncharacterized protein n=1 Tax=Gaoshiqia sediminis TaxID=2986998 RepID=A0AA41Y560_9BACT|nr:hypothetical protein [Gaoshiqia sediminis]MCW0482124.1 hypothetical protein [Gaoshiqia sediminis]